MKYFNLSYSRKEGMGWSRQQPERVGKTELRAHYQAVQAWTFTILEMIIMQIPGTQGLLAPSLTHTFTSIVIP